VFAGAEAGSGAGAGVGAGVAEVAIVIKVMKRGQNSRHHHHKEHHKLPRGILEFTLEVQLMIWLTTSDDCPHAHASFLYEPLDLGTRCSCIVACATMLKK